MKNINKSNNISLENLGNLIIKQEKETKNKQLSVNKTQYSKLKLIEQYFKNNNYKVKTFTSPIELNGGISVKGYVLDFSGKQMFELINLLQHAIAISIDADKYGQVELQLTIPNIYTENKKHIE